MDGAITDVNGFSIIQPLGKGGYGEIYLATSSKFPGKLALKTENIETNKSALAQELEIIKSLPKESCFPNLLENGQTSALYYYAMPFYGPSLHQLQESLQQQKISLASTLKIGIQTLEILKKLHNAGIVHCDVKPANFLLNQHDVGGFVLIDFGLSASLAQILASRQKPRKRRSIGCRGTLAYISLNVLAMEQPTMRDDLISWFYSLIELATGKLPWDDCDDASLILPLKQSISPEKLCVGFPHTFIEIYQILTSLKFEETPPYEQIEQKLNEAMLEIHSTLDVSFDWEEDPSILKKLTPFPELFDPRLEKNTETKQSGKKKKKSCFLL